MIFSFYDKLFIGLYFVVVVVIGLWSSRKQTTESFLIADRKLGTFSSVATIVASKVGTFLLITYLAFVYTFGISAMWFFVGHIVGYILFYFFAKKLKRRADKRKYYTLSDYFLDRFGKKSSYIAASVTLIIYILSLGFGLVATTQILVSLTGIPYLVSLLIIASAIAIYLRAAGFKGVVATDIVQYISIIVLFLVLAIFLGGNFEYHPEQWQLLNVGVINVASFFLGGILLPFAFAELWQRVYAMRDKKVLKRTLVFSSISYFAIGLILSLIGIIIKVKLPGINPDMALVEGFKNLLPANGIMGLATIALFAAIMSSADTAFYTTSSIIVQDFVGKKKKLSPKATVRIMRWVLLGCIIGGLLLAYLIPSLIKIVLAQVAFIAVLTVVVLTTWIFKNINKYVVNFGLVTGSIIVFISSLYFITRDAADPIIVIIAISGVIFSLLLGDFISKRKAL